MTFFYVHSFLLLVHKKVVRVPVCKVITIVKFLWEGLTKDFSLQWYITTKNKTKNFSKCHGTHIKVQLFISTCSLINKITEVLSGIILTRN